MVSLVDLAPITESVPVAGGSVEVVGVSAKGVAILLTRYPELQAMFGSGEDVNVGQLMAFGADAVAAIIAAGVGHPGDESYESAASALIVDDQATLLEAIARLSLPRGLSPFVEKLSKMGALLRITEGAPSKGPVTKSPEPSKPS